MQTGKRLDLSSKAWYIYSVAFSPDGKTVIGVGLGSGDCETRLMTCYWDAETAQLQQSVYLGKSPGCYDWDAVFLSPGRDTIAFRTENKAQASEVQLWDTLTGSLQQKLAVGIEYDSRMVFSSDWRMLAIVKKRSFIQIWDIQTGTTIHSLLMMPARFGGFAEIGTEDIPLSLAFSPHGRILGGTGYEAAHLWDTMTGRWIRTWEAPNPTFRLTIAFSNDNQTAVTGWYFGQGLDTENLYIALWDIQSGQTKRMLQAPKSGYECKLFFSPDDQWLAGADGNGHLYPWRLK